MVYQRDSLEGLTEYRACLVTEQKSSLQTPPESSESVSPFAVYHELLSSGSESRYLQLQVYIESILIQHL